MAGISVFYISLGGIIVLLSYKTFMMRRHGLVKENRASEHDFFTNVCLWISDKIHALASFARKFVFFPLYVCIKHNIKLTHQGFVRFVNDTRRRRNKRVAAEDGEGATSAYLKSILEQKKIVRKKNKVFHSKNL